MNGEYIVSVQGDRFLGFGGDLVREFPDARQFKTKASAETAAGVLRVLKGVHARAISVASYDEGEQA